MQNKKFHENILDELHDIPNPDTLHYVALIDEVVNCIVQIHCLDANSIDPLAAAILKELSGERRLSLNMLWDKMGSKVSVGKRVVSEVLYVLKRAGYVEEKNKLWTCQNGSDLETLDLQVRERIVQKKFQYIPFSKQLSPYLPSMDIPYVENQLFQEGLPWWEASDDETLYSSEALINSIKTACDLLYKPPNNIVYPNYNTGDIRYEILQRSGLKPTDFTYLTTSDVTFLEPVDSTPYIIHRCFLYHPDISIPNKWVAKVFRYRGGLIVDSYTTELNSKLDKNHNKNHNFSRNLLSHSIKLSKINCFKTKKI